MKVLKLIYIFLFSSLFLSAQDKNIQELKKPSEGKALVYIIRSSDMGFLLNFRIFDKDKFIGALPHGNYFLYECEPGEHLFWATSENRDYLEANLEANKIYVIKVKARMGLLIASVALEASDPKIKKDKKLIHWVVRNDSPIVYNPDNVKDEDKKENITKGLDKYNELKADNSSKISILTSDMYFENANKPE